MKNQRCQCGEWSGTPCGAEASELVTVEYMPAHLIALHRAAGNSGVYPANGAARIQVTSECADFMVEQDPKWTSKVSR